MFRVIAVLLAVLGVTMASPAEARRAALIIGNSAYQNASFLPNPSADAALVAQSARKAGFDVTLVTDLTRDGFDQALRNFRSQADGAEVAMIYYAGHGIESAGKNWVIPVDAVLQESRDLRFEAIELDGLLETLTGAQLRIVVLDACRNNPFGNNWRSTVRSVPNGLAETEVEGALVIFAAAGGQVASDGAGANSPFAVALATRLPEPGLSIHRLGSVVREDVVNATGGRQAPWTNMSIDGREFFLVEAPSAKNAGAASGGAPTGGGQGLADAYAWKYADAQDTLDEYRDYVSRFPSGVFVKIAQQRIAAKTGSAAPTQALAAPQPSAPVPVAPAPTPTTTSAPVPSSPASKLVLPDIPQAAPEGHKFPPTDGSDPNSIAFVTANANKVHDRAPLPQMPVTPKFSADGYPNCREDFAGVTDPIGRVVKINGCLSQLTTFFDQTLNGFARAMVQHQQEISQLYTDRVAGNAMYSPESQQNFYREMRLEHAKSNPDGDHFAAYRDAKQRYEEDRAYLQDRYCFNTGTCGGYPVPAGVGSSKHK